MRGGQISGGKWYPIGRGTSRKKSQNQWLTHIDKENIYYSPEEYDCRIEERIKGTARKRIKFFKINDSKIPFEYPCQIINTNFRQEHLETTEKSIPFIFYIVRYFFKNKKNVDEYFSNILD